MKNLGIYVGVLAVLVILIVFFAQSYSSLSGPLQSLVDIEDSSKVFEIVSLLAALIVASTTSVMVWISGRKMHGGVFGKVLNLFSIGMMLVVGGFALGGPWLQNIDHLYLKMVHDSLYIIGYVMMGIAANNLLEVIRGE